MFGKAQSETLKLDVCAGDVVATIKKNFSKLSILPDDDLGREALVAKILLIFGL